MRSTITSSRLVRLLGDALPVDAGAPGMDVAERLGLWFNAFDAMDLQAAHQAVRTLASAAPSKPSASRKSRMPDLTQDLQRARSVLAKAIALDPFTLFAMERDGANGGWGPYQRRHLELQRQMEQMVEALRDHARQVVARSSPPLRQLAALDAAFEPVLARHEQAMLSRLPALLKQRFDQLRHTAEGLDTFTREWRQALLAELELRLEPVTGLIEALNNESTDRE